MIAKLALLAVLGLAGASVMLVGRPPAAKVACFAGVVTGQDSTSITVRPLRRPEMVNDSVFVVPLHPLVLVCTDFQSVDKPTVPTD